MAFTRRHSVYGSRPPCAYSSRLEERRQLIRSRRLERSTRKTDNKPEFIVYGSSDEEEDENEAVNHQILYSSNNFVDYIRAREYRSKEYHTFNSHYGTRHVLSHDMWKEHPIALEPEVNKIHCSAWLSHRQVVCGTRCNKLIVYDVVTKAVDQIPCLAGQRENVNVDEPGINAISINPSRCLIATAGKNNNELGIYKLPTLDPMYIGEEAHSGCIQDIVWLDDQFLATCCHESKVALWRVPEIEPECPEIPSYSSINPLVIKTCKHAPKTHAFAYNKNLSELLTLSLNGYIHVWNIERFKQKCSRKLSSTQEPVCLTVNEIGSMYAVGCRAHTLLIDSRCVSSIKKINSRNNAGIRSISFKSDLLTIGSTCGAISFFDLRAQKYLESCISSTRIVNLRTSRGYFNPEEEFAENGILSTRYTPAIYTHCFDSTGLRLFCGGGPLAPNHCGNYASVWQ